jgi:hypothetical protein
VQHEGPHLLSTPLELRLDTGIHSRPPVQHDQLGARLVELLCEAGEKGVVVLERLTMHLLRAVLPILLNQLLARRQHVH